jgi:hypothetical protein
MTDPKFHCDDCQKVFPVRSFIVRDAGRTGRKIACPGCHSTNTGRVGSVIRKPYEDTSTPPSEAQLNYIRALGGDTRGVKTKKDAGEYISRLKKLKEAES